MSKYIYLDQNKWIELARCYYERDKNEEVNKILSMVLEKSLSGEWIFPLSMIHYNETRTRKQADQRLKLAKFMGIVSRNWSIIPYYMFREGELQDNALNKKDFFPIRHNAGYIFGKNMGPKKLLKAQEIDIDDVQENELLKKCSRLNFFLFFMQMESDDVIDEFNEDNKFYMQAYENLREENKKYTGPEEHKFAILFQQCFRAGFRKLLNKLDITEEQEKILAYNMFKQKIPKSFYTNMYLTYYSKLKNTERKNHINDYKDIVSISEALPYCDVLITEKYWSSIIQEHELDKQFNTIVGKDISILKSV